MTRKRCKRKVWTPNANIVGRVIGGVALPHPKDLDKIRMLELSQIEALASGAGSLADLRGMSDCLNVCETMADAGIGPEALPACAKAQASILAIMRRFERWSKIEAMPGEIDALRDLYAYADLQRQSVSCADFERYVHRTIARIRSNHHRCVEVAVVR